MSTPQTDVQEVKRYLELLYPDPPRDAWLVVSWPVSNTFRQQWFTIAQAAAAPRFMVQKASHYSVYVGLGLRRPDCPRGETTRGTSEDVYAIGGLWIELDHNAGVHNAQHLPTPHELLAFIEALPLRFSLLVDSSGGYHCYALFKELWILDTPEEHQAAALLLRRFQRTIQARAAAQGWQVDGTADLARVLRPTGTLNHKTRPPKPVTFLHEDAIRYNPSEIAEAPWLAAIDDMYTPPADSRDFPPVPVQPIVDGCAWLRHCRNDAARLPEPEWYGMLGIVGRCEDGEQMAHEWSAPYPRYSKDETARKLQHALADAGPRTCSTIRFDLGGEDSCRDCQHWGKIKSPIVLGMLRTQRPMEEQRAMPAHSATRDVTQNGQPPATPGPEAAPASGSEAAREETRPVIRISTEMTAVVDAMQQAILKAPANPVVFQRARRLCHMARGLTPPDWLDRALDAPVITPAAPAYLRELASQTAQWQKLDKRAKRWEPALPPPWTVETLQARASWLFHPLTGIVQAPTLRPDGSLLTTAGYDAATGLYLDTEGVEYPKICAHPTLDDARSAIGHLQEAVRDFPWAHPQHDFSATLAALLSLVARYAIQGNVPLFAVRSNTRGSGKGLLVDVVSTIATGRHAPRWAQTLDEEEEHKRLVTVGLAGDLIVHIDNVRHPLGSGPLDLAITAETISGRILGTQQEIEVPMRVVFFASGNNMVFKGDMARRVVPIDLDPRMERPEERDNFAHPLLLAWVIEKRPLLLVAALTILRAYVDAGHPPQGVKPLGSFEQWSMLVRQALIWAGEADPCEGRKDIEAESDENFERFAALLETWYACYQTTPQTLARVIDDVSSKAVEVGPGTDWNDLRDALGAFDAKYDGKRPLGKPVSYALRTWKGRVIAGKRLVSAGKEHHAAQWQIELLEGSMGV